MYIVLNLLGEPDKVIVRAIHTMRYSYSVHSLCSSYHPLCALIKTSRPAKPPHPGVPNVRNQNNPARPLQCRHRSFEHNICSRAPQTLSTAHGAGSFATRPLTNSALKALAWSGCRVEMYHTRSTIAAKQLIHTITRRLDRRGRGP